jgi:DNA-binding Lrp family transcriptional regulator
MMDATDRKILKLLEANARMETADIAVVTDLTAEEVEKRISALEKMGVICAYKSVIDWEKVDSDSVSAIIELKVTPKAGFGFEEVAARVAKYPEVESVYLMSGAYDLNVVVKGRTFHEVSNFVSRELAMIDSVTSTGTQFVMRRYKEYNVELTGDDEDGRSNISL